MSSISPLVAQRVAAACAAKGVEFIDAPVSGGEPKAIEWFEATHAALPGRALKAMWGFLKQQLEIA